MGKPRVVITTDIGGSDPDDMESMAHALLASDQWNLKALVSTPTNYDGRTADIHKALDAYAHDYANLKTWSSDYPTPSYLKSIVYQGKIDPAPSAGYSNSTEGSRAIVDAAHDAKAAGEPLWVMAWGSVTDIAQALHDDPSIASTVRVLATTSWNRKQDPHAHDYLVNTHAKDGMWMIDSNSTFRGIYINNDGVEDNSFNMNEVKGHGALGDYFHESRPWGVKMGDSWSIAYLTDEASNGNPGADSWGGEYVKKSGVGPNFWTDDSASAYNIAGYNGAKHIREHQSDIYQDMYRLFNRAKSPNPNASESDTSTPETGGSSDPASATATVTATAEEAARVMPLGDSHTYGIVGSYTDRESGGYRLYLADKLDDSGIAVNFVGRRDSGPSTFDNDHEGYSGIHIQHLTAKVADMIPATKPDVILLMAGSNDSAVNTVSTMKTEMGQLIDKLTAHAPDAQILIAGIPPVKPDNTVGMKPAVVDGFNAALPGLIASKASAGAKVKFVDTSSLTVNDISGLDVDNGVHLTHAGHEKLAGLWLDALKDLGVKDGTIDVGASQPETGTPPPSTGGTDNPVQANDDHYTLSPGETKWENSRYLTFNDKGADGGLKVTAVDKVSAAGVAVSWASDGTIKYTAKAGYNGIDTVGYTLVDADGSTDRANMVFTVGDPSKAEPAPAPTPDPEPTPDPAPSTGTGTDVQAQDDHYALASGATKWQAAHYLTWNDKGRDGSLKVTQVDDVSAEGVSVSFENGTIVYRSKAGYNGVDTVGYTVVDADGSSDRANLVFTVGDPAKAEPTPEPDPAPTTGAGNDVHAQDDHYDLASGATKWEASYYLTWNDKGGDGSLKVTQVDGVSAEGASVSFENGTIVYRSKAGFNGTDTIGYTVTDADGSSDRANMVFTVGDPAKAEPTPEPDPAPTAGTGNDVNANDDWGYKVDAGKTLWVNARYFAMNDEGGDGGLRVTAVDQTSAHGGRITFDDEGTTTYKAAAGFTGRDEFDYTVKDADGSTDVATVHVQVADLIA